MEQVNKHAPTVAYISLAFYTAQLDSNKQGCTYTVAM